MNAVKNPYQAPQNIEPTPFNTVKIIKAFLGERLARIHFLFYTLSIQLLLFLTYIGCGYLARNFTDQWSWIPVYLMLTALTIGLLIYLAAFIKRLHDINLSAWYLLIFIIPPLFIFVYIWPGSNHPNKFGKAAKEPNATEAWVVIVTLISLTLTAISQIIYLYWQ